MAHLHTQFPGADNSYRIATDGKHLIIKNVRIRDKFYDIKILRKDEQGKLIEVKTDLEFHTATISQTAHLARDLFLLIDPDQLTKTTVYFSNTGSGDKKYSCCEKIDGEKHEIFSGNLEQIDNLPDQPIDKRKFVYSAEKIHSIFFNKVTCYGLETENQVQKPYYESSFSIKPKKYESREEDKQEKENLLESQNHSIQTPDDSNAHTDSVVTPGSTAQIPLVDNGSSPIEEKNARDNEIPERQLVPIQKPEDFLKSFDQKPGIKGTYLDGITYRGIGTYAKDRSESRYEKPYLHFENLRKHPDSTDKDDQVMYKWLQDLYLNAYKINKNERNDTYQKEKEETKNKRKQNEDKRKQNEDKIKQNEDCIVSFDDWCKDRAARFVAGFIEIKHINHEKLAEKLKTTPIPNGTGSSSAAQGGWFRWIPTWISSTFAK